MEVMGGQLLQMKSGLVFFDAVLHSRVLEMPIQRVGGGCNGCNGCNFIVGDKDVGLISQLIGEVLISRQRLCYASNKLGYEPSTDSQQQASQPFPNLGGMGDAVRG